MYFPVNEINEWEQKLYSRNIKRMYKIRKIYRCPRYEALQDYKHHRGTKRWYSVERKSVRIWSNRRFRRRLKHELYNEVYYRPTPHDYKTYGWLTW